VSEVQVLFIVEGPDGVGKTTLAHTIKKTIRAQFPNDFVFVHHKGSPKTNNGISEYKDPLISYKPNNNEHIICDRWHLGELVYPNVFKRDTIMSTAQFMEIEDFLMQCGTLVIAVTRMNHADHAEQLMDRDDMDVNPDMLPELRHLFDLALTTSNLPVVQHDYDTCGSNGCPHIEKFISIASAIERDAARRLEL